MITLLTKLARPFSGIILVSILDKIKIKPQKVYQPTNIDTIGVSTLEFCYSPYLYLILFKKYILLPYPL